ncbi:Phox-like protein [Rhizoclosmatium globosum]|uniref:Phox-like protein n=1 Tax=Rhizoclosmatium globosum TaxID=329046 RepID=A0A1Y2CTF8_9FUNG|nr:Phox-like protein [Rhizoclosmatium globosum]|eukprot:ORY50338.1 Phox-like protein [Rhizoclosmatium globosum]
MVAKADTEDEERQIEQLTMNKPVKRLVVQNVVQHTGRYYKDYIYIVRVYHSVGAYSIIHQTFDDFFDFHMSLIAQFPEDAGVQSAISGKQSVRIIPEFPPQMMFVSEAVAKLRMQQLQSYSMGIISLPARISRSPYVMKFFRWMGEVLHQCWHQSMRKKLMRVERILQLVLEFGEINSSTEVNR